jgi:Zn ribbon nucleic-acid-binding protein
MLRTRYVLGAECPFVERHDQTNMFSSLQLPKQPFTVNGAHGGCHGLNSVSSTARSHPTCTAAAS